MPWRKCCRHAVLSLVVRMEDGRVWVPPSGMPPPSRTRLLLGLCACLAGGRGLGILPIGALRSQYVPSSKRSPDPLLPFTLPTPRVAPSCLTPSQEPKGGLGAGFWGDVVLSDLPLRSQRDPPPPGRGGVIDDDSSDGSELDGTGGRGGCDSVLGGGCLYPWFHTHTHTHTQTHTQQEPEDKEHFLWRCTAWKAKREPLIAEIMLVAKVLKLDSLREWPPCIRLCGMIPDSVVLASCIGEGERWRKRCMDLGRVPRHWLQRPLEDVEDRLREVDRLVEAGAAWAAQDDHPWQLLQ